MNSLFDIRERVIILTGGYGILGACMAKHLAKEGATVVILGRDPRKGAALVDAIRAEGGEALFVPADVLDKPSLERSEAAILATYGRIDVLINLAGGNQAGATVPPGKNCRSTRSVPSASMPPEQTTPPPSWPTTATGHPAP